MDGEYNCRQAFTHHRWFARFFSFWCIYSSCQHLVFFLKTGSWVEPKSRLYTHLGQTTVALFFMITGFLFYCKILDNSIRPIDWLRLYVSRCLRIFPLYLLTILFAVIFIVLIRYSGWVSIMQPPWNEKSLYGLFTTGVTWTLSYEWKFYFTLPLIALAVIHVSWHWLIFCTIMLVLTAASKALDIHACAFLGGIAAAFLTKSNEWKRLANSKTGNFCALGTVFGAVMGFESAYAPIPLVLLIFSFALVANGTDFWGLLAGSLPRYFGDLAFSIYLIHGPLLFIIFRLVIEFDNAEQLDPIEFWGVVALITPVLVVVSALSYKKLELPFMRKTDNLTLLIKKFCQRLR